NIKTIAIRQHDVEQNEVEGIRARSLQRNLPIRSALYLVTFFGKPVGKGHYQAGFIFHKQDASFHHAIVSDIQNVDPPPGFDVTVSSPPCRSTVCFTRLSPRPLPWIWASIAARPR